MLELLRSQTSAVSGPQACLQGLGDLGCLGPRVSCLGGCLLRLGLSTRGAVLALQQARRCGVQLLQQTYTSSGPMTGCSHSSHAAEGVALSDCMCTYSLCWGAQDAALCFTSSMSQKEYPYDA